MRSTLHYGYLWLCLIISSLIILTSTSPLNTPDPAITILDSSNTTSAATNPLISTFIPQPYAKPPTLNRRGPFDCHRKNKGLHNCPLMKESCYELYRQLPKEDDRRRNYRYNCKMHICIQTGGDCFHWFCNYCT